MISYGAGLHKGQLGKDEKDECQEGRNCINFEEISWLLQKKLHVKGDNGFLVYKG